MNSNNKKRILKLIEILKKNTDMDHKLTLNQITTLLQENNIDVQNRKTLYNDFKVINDFGYEVEYDDGYYLTEAPFSLSEVKIIIDSCNSLKNLDDKFLMRLNNKLYSFTSTYEESLLKKLEYRNKHSDKNFINRLEDCLCAIKDNRNILIKKAGSSLEDEISPIFLHRYNDYYYLYYHYQSNDEIYHMRFDNIVSIKQTDNLNEIYIPTNKIIDRINQSTNSFYNKNFASIEFKISKDSEYLRNRLADDFPNIIFTKDGFNIKASVNDIFFSKLTSYGEQIKISDKNIADQYTSFLQKIINHNKAKD